MLSDTEYGILKTVIVGDATDARIPDLDISTRTINYVDKKLEEIPSAGLYPKQVIEEANEDLETFCQFLIKENVEVLRPNREHKPLYYNYCPRDTVLVYKDTILAAPSPIRARANEYKAFEHHLKKYTDPVRIIIKRDDSLYNQECLGNPDQLSLNEIEPAFDAANVLRDGDNLYYLVSNSGNELGANYLKELFPKSYVWPIKGVYSYMHLDSTLAILRDGLLLCNPARIKRIDQLPKPLQSYDIIWCPEPYDIGHYPGICNASIWINMNLFSINSNLVVLEKNQNSLRKELEKYGIDCAMLPMRHQRTLGGGFHCVTLDLVRK